MLFDFPGVKAVLDDFVTADLLKVGEIYMKLWTEVLIHTGNYRIGLFETFAPSHLVQLYIRNLFYVRALSMTEEP